MEIWSAANMLIIEYLKLLNPKASALNTSPEQTFTLRAGRKVPLRTTYSKSSTGKMHSENRRTVSQSVPKDLHEAEKTLEMQKTLLQKLARRENIIKGYQDGTMNGQRNIEAERDIKSATTELEEWKRQMALVLHTIWSGNSQRRSNVSFSAGQRYSLNLARG